MHVLLAGFSGLVIMILLGPATIAFLRRLRFGQHVRSDGPQSHLGKKGTPTMGGILIIFAFTMATLWLAPSTVEILPVLVITLGFGLIGVTDDLVKILSRRSLGLKARHKLILQGLLGIAAAMFAASPGGSLQPVSVIVPFAGGTTLLLDPLPAILLGMLAVVGTANAVNLSDGLDGLVAGSMAIAAATYAFVAWHLGYLGIAVFAGAITGACLGFLWFNSHPALVFMGDTGSLALGAALSLMAIWTGTHLLLPIIGGLFVIETLSDIVQVVYFRLTGGRRVFRMAPLHHHLELSGWQETQVVARFWILALIFAVCGLIGFRGF